jgi:microcystin-dependent protein
MDYYIGEIELFPYGFAPMGWLLCDGRQLPIVQYTPLYSLIGVNFGGDGRINFNLPNLTGYSPVNNTDYYIAVYGLYPTRE